MQDEFGDIPDAQAPAPQPQHRGLGSVDDVMAAGTPAAKFETVGTVVRGTILSAEVAQQRDLATGALASWPDGNPKVQVLIDLQTAERSADIDDDDGRRRLYVKRPSAMLAAIAKALGKTKLSEAVGGTLAVKYTGNGTPSQRGFNPPKQFAAVFKPANVGNVDAAVSGAPAQVFGKREAWEAWKKVNGANGEAMKSALAAYFPGKTPDVLTPAEWQEFVANDFSRPVPTNPIPETGGIPEDEIPFDGAPLA